MRPSDFLSDDDWAVLWARLRLSPRERVIARLVLDDTGEEAMADELGIAAATVHTHLMRLYRKVGVSGRPQLVTRLFREYVVHLQAGT
jgi:DNA-binding CsgD family transcriptional regulator